MAEPLIELRGVSKAFGDKVILDQVDLSIDRGEALAIIGPSGTGKSTILRIISGLLAPDAGEVYIQGQRRQGLLEDGGDGIDISLVFQQAALFDSLTVEENVGFVLFRYSRLSYEKIRELVDQKLEMVGLPGTNDLYPAELSGGMRKRVSFARAIMPNPLSQKVTPDVLLYDEPTAGLDPIASTIIEDLIRHLRGMQSGCSTYAVVTHQDSTIRRTADRVVFLYRGKVQWQGTTEQAYTVDHPMVRQFFSGRVEGPIHVAD
jgi:phospholipid/cholesterol/gamma-HCH transport system ATP-binding protein